MAIDPVHRRLYTANLGAGGAVIPSVSVLNVDTRTLVTTIDIGKPARAITVNPYAHQEFVAGDSRVTLIGTDTLSVQRFIPAELPFAVATADGPGRQFYLGDLRSGELTRLSYSSVSMP